MITGFLTDYFCKAPPDNCGIVSKGLYKFILLLRFAVACKRVLCVCIYLYLDRETLGSSPMCVLWRSMVISTLSDDSLVRMGEIIPIILK